MPEIQPFFGWRYNPQAVDLKKVLAPPYDIVSPEEGRRYLTQDPHNIFHLELGNRKTEGYFKARQTLETWIKKGILIREKSPSIYLYKIHFSHHGKNYTRTGFVALVRLSPFEEGKIRPHEKTFPKVTQDRLELLRATSAQFSQIFTLYRDPSLKTLAYHFPARLLYQVEEERPRVRHEFYRIEDPESQRFLQEELGPKVFYIADGHHRYTTALNFAQEMERRYGPDGPRCFHYMMMYFCPFEDPGLLVLPTHRVVHFRIPVESVRSQLHTLAEVLPVPPSALEKEVPPGTLLWASSEGLFQIRPRREVLSQWEKETGLPEKDLPAAWCARFIRLLYGKTEKDLKEEGKLEYTPWLSEIYQALEQGAQAFLLPSTPVSVLEEVARAGKVMPHKSTYFYPKILTGLVIFRINPEVGPPCP